jgi:hypothetical protein
MQIEFHAFRQIVISLPRRHCVISLGVYPRIRPRRRWVTLPAFGINTTRRVRHLGPNAETGVIETTRQQRITRAWAPFLILVIGTNELDTLIMEDSQS